MDYQIAVAPDGPPTQGTCTHITVLPSPALLSLLILLCLMPGWCTLFECSTSRQCRQAPFAASKENARETCPAALGAQVDSHDLPALHLQVPPVSESPASTAPYSRWCSPVCLLVGHLQVLARTPQVSRCTHALAASTRRSTTASAACATRQTTVTRTGERWVAGR